MSWLIGGIATAICVIFAITFITIAGICASEREWWSAAALAACALILLRAGGIA